MRGAGLGTGTRKQLAGLSSPDVPTFPSTRHSQLISLLFE